MAATAQAATAGTASPERTIVHLVPHTHWDREWYLPFQTFRMRLVDLVDQLLDTMDADPHLRFTLDGQVATVDDYLEVRPEARARIEALVREGRLAIGPWQILLDEFLVSGETIIRDLETGWHAAQRFGRVMNAGYLPDMFGHVAQMPQILRRAGISDAVVWRGVPAAVDRSAFRWTAPDGSMVRAQYLLGGYGNAAYLLAAPDRLTQVLGRFLEEARSFHGDRSVLAMYGTDHAVPSPRLTELVAQANEAQDGAELRIETLADYLDAVRGEPLDHAPAWTGELRSGARANMLMGVTSARIDIKQHAARAERALARYAEPFAALHGEGWPDTLLGLAWRRVIDDSAHDSICGCSRDEVVDQVLVRFAEAEQIAAGLLERALRPAAARVPRGGWVVANPSPYTRTAMIELVADVPEGWVSVSLELPDGTRVPTQAEPSRHPLMVPFTLLGRDVPDLFARRAHGRELFGRSLDGYRVEQAANGPRLVLLLDDPQAPDELDLGELIEAVTSEVAAAPDVTWEVVPAAPDRRRLLASVTVPPLGWTSVRVVEGTAELPDAVRVTPSGMGNGLVELELADDGTFRLTGGGVTLDGVGRIVDGGDFGDSYNHAPPRVDHIVDRPDAVTTRVLEHGPARGRLEVVRRYGWPHGLLPDGAARNDTLVPTEVTTHIELRADEPFVRLRLLFRNESRDHRVRWHIPLPTPTDASFAEGQFAVVRRGLVPEAGHGEVPLPTAPASAFVHAAGTTVLLDHVTEYELVDGRELALTLLRATGLISRNGNPYREDPAGPEVPIPGAQMLRDWWFGFAIVPHAGSWEDADAVALAEAYGHPFVTAPGSAGVGRSLADAAGLQVDGRGVALTALRRRGEWLEARLVAERGTSVTAVVRGSFSEAREVDLLGRPGAPLRPDDGGLELSLGPWEIRTLQLR